ncbi:MAG: hypothetical protein V7L11_02025 [Nostoc sp.]
MVIKKFISPMVKAIAFRLRLDLQYHSFTLRRILNRDVSKLADS